MDHPAQPEQRRVGVGPPHALDECGDHVEMVVAAIVGDDPLLDRVGDARAVDHGLAGVGEQDGGLERRQRRSGVARGELDEVIQRVVGERDAERPHPALRIDHGELEEHTDLIRLERLEAEEQTPRDQRTDEAVVRVLRRRADQRDRAVLDRRQEDLLLRLVPTVDLVDEQDGAEERRLGVVHHAPRVRHAGAHRGELLEIGPHRDREEVGERGLPGARGAPQDHGGEVPAIDQLGERLALSEEVVMSDELLEVARAHARRERSIHARRSFPTIRVPTPSGRRQHDRPSTSAKEPS